MLVIRKAVPLIQEQQVQAGLALLDEAMLAAIAGELSPIFDVRSEIATVSAYRRGSGTRDRIDSIPVPVEPDALTIVLFFLPAVF